MLAYLLEHVVEESQAGVDIALSRTVEVEAHVDVCFLGHAVHFRQALTAVDYLRNLVPRHAVFAQDERLATEVGCQLAVTFAVADHIAACHVHLRVVHVGSEHAGAGFAHGRMVFRKVSVNKLFFKGDAFALQGLDDEIVHWPERVLGE